MRNSLYTDINSYTPNKKETLTDLECIYQSINNVLDTVKGEIFFFIDDGSNLDDTLFDLVEPASTNRLMNDIIIAMQKDEPRVIVDRALSQITTDTSTNEHSVNLKLVFQVKGYEGQNYSLTKKL